MRWLKRWHISVNGCVESEPDFPSSEAPEAGCSESEFRAKLLYIHHKSMGKARKAIIRIHTNSNPEMALKSHPANWLQSCTKTVFLHLFLLNMGLLASANAQSLLENARASFTRQLEALEQGDRAVKELHVNYLLELRKLEKQVTDTGDLDGVLQIRNEMARFEKDRELEAFHVVKEPARLRAVQLNFQRAITLKAEDTGKQKEKLVTQYLEALERKKVEFTRQSKIEEALAFKQEINRVNALYGTSGSETSDEVPLEAENLSPGFVRAKLIGYYNFAGDAMPYPYRIEPLTFEVAAGPDRFGKPAAGLNFNGENHILSVAPRTPYDAVDRAFTLSAWVHPARLKNFRLFSCAGKGNRGLFTVAGSSVGGLTAHLRGGAGESLTVRSKYIPRWMQITVTFDGTTLKLFVNGNLRGTDQEKTLGAIPLQSGILHIGSEDRTPGSTLEGGLDDLRLYARCFSDAEVRALYELEKRDEKAQRTALQHCLNNLKIESVDVKSASLSSSKPRLGSDVYVRPNLKNQTDKAILVPFDGRFAKAGAIDFVLQKLDGSKKIPALSRYMREDGRGYMAGQTSLTTTPVIRAGDKVSTRSFSLKSSSRFEAGTYKLTVVYADVPYGSEQRQKIYHTKTVTFELK